MNQTLNQRHPLQEIIEKSSRIVFGCMGLGGSWDDDNYDKSHIKQAHHVIDAALENGITLFDHADIYTSGKAERVFGEVLQQRPELRSQIALQSKCGIRFADQDTPGRYDYSMNYITESVNGILSRLGVEQIELLILHRPDPLMEAEEVALAFELLKKQGKVSHFGVSNMQLHQMDYINSCLSEPLVTNQLELSLSQLAWLEEGVTSVCSGFESANFVSGTLEYCRKNNVQLQSWGSLSQGLFSGKDITNQPAHIQSTAVLVSKLANEYQVSKEAIVLAWLMRHPAKIQPVIGTTNSTRITACCQAQSIELSREHWYSLYVSARGAALP